MYCKSIYFGMSFGVNIHCNTQQMCNWCFVYKSWLNHRNLNDSIRFLGECLCGPLARYVKMQGCACAGNAGNDFLPSQVSDPDMHHGTCVTYVPWCVPESLTSGFLWSQWQGKRSRHSRRMRNPQFYISVKRPMKATIYMLLNYYEEMYMYVAKLDSFTLKCACIWNPIPCQSSACIFLCQHLAAGDL